MSLMSFLNNSNKQKVAVLPDGNASNLDELFTNLIEKTLPKIETVIKWDNLLLEYIQQKDAIFFIRRYASASNKQWDLYLKWLESIGFYDKILTEKAENK